MKVPAVRGAMLEELVLHLLKLVGYRTVTLGEDGTKNGAAGLEVRGRGAWHQIDALAAFDRTPAFMYPLRLMIEAKCYARRRPVGIEIVRNAVGVLKDISENYFTYQPRFDLGDEIQIPRFNYHAAIFSSSGYTSGAQRYAIAHQIFLIQYKRIPVLAPVIDALLELEARHLQSPSQGTTVAVTAAVRKTLRLMLDEPIGRLDIEQQVFSEEGFRHLKNAVVSPLLEIRGSYFGMLQGKWPMHLLSRSALSPVAFADRDEIRCRVYGRESDRWSFSPIDSQEGDERWFRLEFDIPEEILGLVQATRKDPHALAQVKQRQFSFLDLAGRIGGVYRQVRLQLDEEWLEAYLQRIRARR